MSTIDRVLAGVSIGQAVLVQTKPRVSDGRCHPAKIVNFEYTKDKKREIRYLVEFWTGHTSWVEKSAIIKSLDPRFKDCELTEDKILHNIVENPDDQPIDENEPEIINTSLTEAVKYTFPLLMKLLGSGINGHEDKSINEYQKIPEINYERLRRWQRGLQRRNLTTSLLMSNIEYGIWSYHSHELKIIKAIIRKHFFPEILSANSSSQRLSYISQETLDRFPAIYRFETSFVKSDSFDSLDQANVESPSSDNSLKDLKRKNREDDECDSSTTIKKGENNRSLTFADIQNLIDSVLASECIIYLAMFGILRPDDLYNEKISKKKNSNDFSKLQNATISYSEAVENVKETKDNDPNKWIRDLLISKFF
ncbi:hypothetical protein HK096_002902 [Nowakowskiella sp. JEL0078]|nr:hypothetical protein HK096_002902 [Nowakowskiella sp. JEL0078]